ncbi:MAG: hypothetical protein ABIO70_15880, partial [Pseudomonadota bacterium]
MRRGLPLLPLLIAPVLLLRDGLASGRFLGQPFGEGWGHLYSVGQAVRWLGGGAWPGRADLLAYPDGMGFWPVDPLVTGLGAMVAGLGGGGATAIAAGWMTAVLLLLFTAGLGGWVLARTAGAGPWAATAAGLGLQLHPYLLRSAQDGVVEVLALGMLAAVGAAALYALRHPGRRAWVLLLVAGLAVAAASPYYAVYAVIYWVALAPWMLWRGRRTPWLRVGLVLGLAFGLVAAPLLVAESGPGGRLDPRFQSGGFQLAPQNPVLMAVDGSLAPAPARLVRPARPLQDERKPTESWRDLRPLQSFPGGLVCALALGLGLLSRRGRPWALLALALFALGAGPQLLMRTLVPRAPVHWSPLQELLQLLPLTRQLGNAQRLVVLYVLPALVGGACALGERARWALLLATATLAEALLVLPGLRFATTDVDVDAAVLAALDGPTVTFPVGDPPLWCGRAPPQTRPFPGRAPRPARGRRLWPRAAARRSGAGGHPGSLGPRPRGRPGRRRGGGGRPARAGPGRVHPPAAALRDPGARPAASLADPGPRPLGRAAGEQRLGGGVRAGGPLAPLPGSAGPPNRWCRASGGAGAPAASRGKGTNRCEGGGGPPP